MSSDPICFATSLQPRRKTISRISPLAFIFFFVLMHSPFFSFVQTVTPTLGIKCIFLYIWLFFNMHFTSVKLFLINNIYFVGCAKTCDWKSYRSTATANKHSLNKRKSCTEWNIHFKLLILVLDNGRYFCKNEIMIRLEFPTLTALYPCCITTLTLHFTKYWIDVEKKKELKKRCKLKSFQSSMYIGRHIKVFL